MSIDEKAFREFCAAHGIEITDEKLTPDEETVLVCMKVGDAAPAVPSIEGECDGCYTPIFWSKNAPKVDRRLCLRCVQIESVRNEQRLTTTPDIMAEVIKALKSEE